MSLYTMREGMKIHVLRIQMLVFFGLLFCLSGVGVFASGSPSADNNTVKIEYGYPDQSIFVATINDQGQPDSPMTNLAEVLMSRAGLPWQATRLPAKRLFENLKNGTMNFSILVRASSLKACCLFSREPVYSTMLNVYYVGDKPPVKSAEDLNGKEIITIRGYSYAGLLKYISDPANAVDNHVASTHKAAFRMLKRDRADYLIDYASAADDILSEDPIDDIRSYPISRLDIFLILSKSYPDAQNQMNQFEDIIKTLNVDEILKGRH